MLSWKNLLVASTIFGAMTVSYAVPAQAMGRFNHWWANSGGGKSGSGNGGGPSHGGGGGGGSVGGNKGAPGPIAGAGLPFLLIAGGYVLVRRYRNRSRPE